MSRLEIPTFGLGQAEQEIIQAAEATGEAFHTEPASYAYQVTLTADQDLPDQSQLFDGDSWFYWTEIYGSATSTYKIQFRLPSGRWMSSAKINHANQVGTAQFPVFLDPLVKVRPNGRIGINIEDTSSAENTVELIFGGYKIFAQQ